MRDSVAPWLDAACSAPDGRNYGDEDIDITQMYVKDNGESHWHPIPAVYSSHTAIRARGHLLLRAEGGLPPESVQVGFELGKSSDQIGVYDGFNNPIDVVSLTNQIEDRFRSRLPDGSSNRITSEMGGAAKQRTTRLGKKSSACETTGHGFVCICSASLIRWMGPPMAGILTRSGGDRRGQPMCFSKSCCSAAVMGLAPLTTAAFAFN